MKPSNRAARMRERRRNKGLKETTIWLSVEADKIISDLVTSKGLKNRSEAVQYALNQVSAEETKMTT